MIENKPLTAMDRLARVIADTTGVAFAILIGSRTGNTAQAGSDWDIAVCWRPTGTPLTHIGQHEMLRHRLAQCLDIPDEKIDLIDLASARLAMKAVVVEEGTVLHIQDDLAWAYFQTATWRELEDYYWHRAHAA